MAERLNETAFEYAKLLVNDGKVVVDERDDWSDHQPTAQEENAFIHSYGFGEYAKWHLGIEEDDPENTKARYKFPFGDFRNVHRCGLLAAESRAGQYKHYDIEKAAAELLEMTSAHGRARI